MTEEVQQKLVLPEDIKKNLAKLSEDEGWEQPQTQYHIDRFWNPGPQDVGVELRGVYLETRTFTAKSDGTEFQTIVMVTPEKETVGVTQTAVLESKLAGINPGDGIWLKYEGKQKNRKGPGSHHNFTVRLKRMGTPVEEVEQAPTLMANDDPKIREFYEQLKVIVGEEYGNPKSAEELVFRAEKCVEDKEMTPEELTRLKVIIAQEVKSGNLQVK